MSSAAISPQPLVSTDRRLPGSVLGAAAAIVAVAVVGLFSIAFAVTNLWGVWTTDPLRSIGMFFPLVSLALILREAHRLGWRLSGTWWGLVPLALAIGISHLRDAMMLVVEWSPGYHLYFPPDPQLIFLYALGFVLLFGGVGLLRRSIFPLLLLLCLNPVPHSFNRFVDVPLQYVSAHIARSFAFALGQKLTPDQLRLMFTPEFGIYIAPGCNGIRGSITMGYIALITGFLCRFPLRLHTLTVLGAVALGYVFNFLRLCILVIFYVIALHFPWMQGHGKNVDYGIGSCLFTIAAVLLAQVVLRARERVKRVDTPAVPAPNSRLLTTQRIAPKLAVLAALLLVSSLTFTRPLLGGASARISGHAMDLQAVFPPTIGRFVLVRTWKEDGTDPKIESYDWALYRDPAGPDTVTFGISPSLGVHDAILCHVSRGEDPGWQGTTVFKTQEGEDVAFSSFFYNDGVSQFVESSTLCGPTRCGERSTQSTRFKVLYSTPEAGTLVDARSGKPVPVILKVTSTDVGEPSEAARVRLTGEMGDFVRDLGLQAIAGRYFQP